MIGRTESIQHLRNILDTYRIVTLTGPGGIGKSRLALEVAHGVLRTFEGNVWLVELVSLSDPGLVAAVVAGALGLELVGDKTSAGSIVRAIGGRRLLLVLDNCEHIIDAVAELAETIVRMCPHVSVLATSREPLRIDGEYTYQVPALDVPAESPRDAGDLGQHSAIRLFVARTQAQNADFSPHAADLSRIAAICRRLDGIPLAIEFAAARAATLGIDEVLARLDDRFRLLTEGRRLALPRHRTLRATLDWSYRLLPEAEQALLPRLAVFAAPFTFEAAVAILGDITIPSGGVEEGIANLVTKSLVAVDFQTTTVRYRLLETTRAYAREKLIESGELDRVARLHAEYHRDLFEQAERELETRSANDWLATHGRQIDEVRAALEWAFSPAGDPSIGVSVTVAAVPLWFQLSLLSECRRWVEHALSILGSGSSQTRQQEMELLAALAESLSFTVGSVEAFRTAWTRVLEIADGLQDRRHRLRALGGLWVVCLSSGEFRAALALAQRAREVAVDDADAPSLLLNDRMMGASLHYLGDQTGARSYLEHALDRAGAAPYRSPTWGAQVDPLVSMRSMLARIYWLQGFPDQATRIAESAVTAARVRSSGILLCLSLTWATCPVAMLNGDLAAVEAAVADLLELSSQHDAGIYDAWGRRYDAMVRIRRGDAVGGVAALRAALADQRERHMTLADTSGLCDLAQALGLAGQVADGLATIDQALARCRRIEELWCLPELLRVKGALLLLEHSPRAVAMAEDHFVQALDWARRQGAMSWELRAAMSLARLWHDQARDDQAHELLAPIYQRFTEGFETADLRAAKTLIDRILIAQEDIS